MARVLPIGAGGAVLALALQVDRHAPRAGAALLLQVAEPAAVLGAEAAGVVAELPTSAVSYLV